MAGTKQDAERFVAEWQGRGNEDQDTQLFWIDLMQGPLGLDDALRRLRFEVPTKTDADSDHEGYVDVLIPSAKVLVEQKSLGIDLDKPEMRQGRPVTPVQQALGYSRGMRWEDKPRYLITCNFSTFRVYDLNKDPLCQGEPLTLELADLPRNVAALRFLDGGHAAPASLQQAVSEQAGAFMGHIHDLIAAKFKDPDSPGSHHALSVLCTRLMFLMFCEDSGLIEPDTFHDFLQAYNGSQLRQALLTLFRWLDTPDGERDLDYAEDVLRPFPYMDGGLFSEVIEIPMLDDTIWNDLITTGCQEYDWSNVDPTVFGSIFEGALSHDARRAGGMHYTSPENIHKVIDPLFLDGLTQELDGILEEPAYNKRMAALERYHDKLGNLTFLDPACGSGNFLTETYVCLRRLENRVLSEERRMQQASDRRASAGQKEWAFEASFESPVKVKPSHFHGIEINDFACCVARTALWIAEKQADTDTQKVISRVYDEFPLTDYETIVEGNALRIDWNEVVPASECDYVMGNPPFIGATSLTDSQKGDRERVFSGNGGTLDYVACWYKKAAGYTRDDSVRCAFVSTNSICQGQQVEPLWKPLFEDGIRIDFAWLTFVWNSEATDEAHVHVVIVGFSREDVSPKRILSKSGSRDVEHINAYLIAASDEFIASRSKPLCNVPRSRKGSSPTDDGCLIINTEEERRALLQRNPGCEKYIRRYCGADEFLNNTKRWCLWMTDYNPSDMRMMPDIADRLKRCRDYRSSRTRPQTLNAADTPWLFVENRQPTTNYLIIPRHSSANRSWIPFGFVKPEVIASDATQVIPDADLYLFGMLSSKVHNAWMRAVCGRIKSDYRYSVNIVYNNFIWPDVTDGVRDKVSACGQAVLDARKLYPESSLADLYSIEFMPKELRSAHRALDAAVEAAYGVDFGGDEDRIVAHLFSLYAEKS